jgi:UPF0755 protein
MTMTSDNEAARRDPPLTGPTQARAEPVMPELGRAPEPAAAPVAPPVEPSAAPAPPPATVATPAPPPAPPAAVAAPVAPPPLVLVSPAAPKAEPPHEPLTLTPDAGARPAPRPEPKPKPSARERRRARRGANASSREWVVFGSSLLSLLAIFGLVAVMTVGRVFDVMNRPGPLAADRTVIVTRSQGVEGVAQTLEDNGVIRDANAFVWAATLTAQRGNLKAGEFAFPRGATMRQVMDILASGRVVQHAITIPEGLTSWQIVQLLREKDVLAGDIRQVPPEGSLFPSTYRVPRGYPRERLLRQMTEDRNRILAEVWARRRPDLPVRSPEELVTLASIVEKETGVASERARVAGVFVNRLNRRMRLESDPTIIYGLTEGRGVLGRGILRSEITRAHPYNTYTIPALPPGPIANVGREALEAAANPMRSNELFFVADGTGGHVFAATLAEHNRNVARWREIERARGGEVSPGLDAAPEAPRPARPAPRATPTAPQAAPSPGAPLRGAAASPTPAPSIR